MEKSNQIDTPRRDSMSKIIKSIDPKSKVIVYNNLYIDNLINNIITTPVSNMNQIFD